MGSNTSWHVVSSSGVVLLLGFVLLPALCFSQHKETPAALLDLSQYDFTNNEPVSLDTEWEFYWKQLLPPEGPFEDVSGELRSIPHLWNRDSLSQSFGYATYRLKIILPDDYPPLAFSIPDLYTAYAFYANGKPIASNGTVGTNPDEHEPQWLPVTVPLDQFEASQLELVLNVSNFQHVKGGIRIPVYLGRESEMVLNREFELGFAFLLTGSLIMAGLFFIGLYLYGRNEKPILYFSLFCFCYSYRIFGTELYPFHLIFQELPWLITVKAEYLSLYLSPVLFGLFIKSLYPEEVNRYIVHFFNSIFLIFSLIVVFFPPYYFTQLIDFFFATLPWYILYSTWAFIKALINKRQGAKYALASVIVIFAVFFQNLFEYLVLIEENLFFSLTGYLLFFFLQSLVLTDRAAQSLNKAKEEAEQASIAKSQFLSTMGHELRTPLNAVIGMSELLMDTKSKKEQAEYAHIIKKSGESLLGIINNILDYSKIESGHAALEHETVHLPSFVQETTKILKGLTNDKEVSLTDTSYLEDTEHYIIDKTRLRQVLINLIGNAIKFTDQGEVRVELMANIHSERKGNLLFRVSDTGIGIPEKELNKLFLQFTQVDSRLSRKYGGTGLGLAISRKLIEQMGGEIWVESTPGKGSVFYFTILADSSPPQSEFGQESTPKQHDASKVRILVAEDNLVNQKVILKMLERLGYVDTDLVSNGLEVIEMISKHSYDLVFMDMEMPEMDGLEATRRIMKRGNQNQHPVIIAITANASEEDKQRCLQAGMKDFIPKPITLTSIQNTINKWVPEIH